MDWVCWELQLGSHSSDALQLQRRTSNSREPWKSGWWIIHLCLMGNSGACTKCISCFSWCLMVVLAQVMANVEKECTVRNTRGLNSSPKSLALAVHQHNNLIKYLMKYKMKYLIKCKIKYRNYNTKNLPGQMKDKENENEKSKTKYLIKSSKKSCQGK